MDKSIAVKEAPMKKSRRQYLALFLTFFLGLRQGKIILWQSGSAESCRVFPYRSETLPPSIRQDLEDGIPFDSAAEALETAENFFS